MAKARIDYGVASVDEDPETAHYDDLTYSGPVENHRLSGTAFTAERAYKDGYVQLEERL